MREATFMDNIGLNSDPQTEVHWFRGKNQVVLTGTNLSAVDRTVTLTINLKALGRRNQPKRTRSAASNTAVKCQLDGKSQVIKSMIPAGQVDAFILDW